MPARLTYACFPNHPLEGHYTDVGWGCTYRAGQMLLLAAAQSLGMTGSAWVADAPDAPASIHRLARGAAGAWATPTHVTQALAACTVPGLRMHTLRHLAPRDYIFPVLLLVPMRLGVTVIEPHYARRLLELTVFPGFCGGVGGVGSRSFYMHRLCDEGRVYGLDPHVMRLEPRTVDTPLDTVAATVLATVDTLDPCLALGFVVCSTFLRDMLLQHLHHVPLAVLPPGQVNDLNQPTTRADAAHEPQVRVEEVGASSAPCAQGHAGRAHEAAGDEGRHAVYERAR